MTTPPTPQEQGSVSGRERGILMSGDNPKLIRDGRKTQTRRIMKPQPMGDWTGPMPCDAWPCPYGVAGDRIWVRETWALPPSYDPRQHGDLKTEPRIGPVCYWSDFAGRKPWDGSRWRPSIHMPRWASRITLEILKVRVERLQDISEADAIAELGAATTTLYGEPAWTVGDTTWQIARNAYHDLWDSLHGKGAWDANPWVWVLEFRRMQGSEACASQTNTETLNPLTK